MLVSPTQVRLYTEQIDLIARLVANLPEQPATSYQSELLKVMAEELARRAKEVR